METIYLEMLRYLANQEQATSKKIAQELSISSRTVKTYVSTINMQYDDIIIATRSGYYVDKEKYRAIVQERAIIPQNYETRAIYIIKKLLLEHSYELDIYDLCDELCIGYSTAKADIQKLNVTYRKYEVSFFCQKDCLKMVGEEKAKRKLAAYIISCEANENFLNIAFLEESFPNIHCKQLAKTLFELLQTHQYYLNDFSLMNFIMHLSILLDRVINGNVLIQNDCVCIEDEQEVMVLNEICTMLQQMYQIQLNEQERFEIYVLFKSNANLAIYDNMNHLAKMVEPHMLDLLQNIMKKIDHLYGISLQTNSFLIPFSIHMKGLYFRLKNHTMVRNPMALSMKEHCPFIYDMAVCISQQIKDALQLTICEDEIAYIALHLGAEIERQQVNKTKLSCLLICPNYHNMNTQLYNQLLTYFGNFIYIVLCIPKEEDVKESYDLVLSTMPLSHAYPCRTYTFLPFTLEGKKSELMDIIQKTIQQKKRERLQTELHTYLNPSLFFIEQAHSSSDEVLHHMANTLQKEGYVDEQFLPSILAREELSSTAFGTIAIPHAIDVLTMKSGICIYISAEGILWKTQQVHIVFMLAIHQSDKQAFSHVYGALVELFENKDKMNQLIACTSFHDFYSCLFA